MEFFEKMTRKQAEKYFRAYINGHQRRVEEFRQGVAADGGPSLEELDFSPKSLVPLWVWMMPRLKPREHPWREGESASEWGGTFYSRETLRLIDGLASYFAECLLRNLPGLHWTIGYLPGKRHIYIDQNQPVLAGFTAGVELNPRQVILNLCGGAYEKNPRHSRPESLLELYRAWEKNAVGSTPPSDERKAKAETDEADGEITIRVGNLEVGLYRLGPDASPVWLNGYDGYEVVFDDDAYVRLEEDYQWNETQFEAMDANLFAKLVEFDQRVAVIWEDKEVPESVTTLVAPPSGRPRTA